MSYKKIMIAVDSSEYSLTAAKKGFKLAHQLNATTALLFVIDSTKAIGNIDAGIFPEESLLILKKEAEQTIDAIEKLYNGKELIKMMPMGHPVLDIVKSAENFEADLIVIGTHGRTGLKHLLMGSVAESVVRNSKIPVMIVPSK